MIEDGAVHIVDDVLPFGLKCKLADLVEEAEKEGNLQFFTFQSYYPDENTGPYALQGGEG